MAIILPKLRPAIKIAGGRFDELTEPWLELENSRATIERAISCVGRLESSDQSFPFLSTAFMVGENVALTTRHVAETFTVGIGDTKLRFRDNRNVWINFKAETSDGDSDRAAVTEVVFIHPYWDVAALRIETQRPFLKLATFRPLANSAAVAIGYPAFDMRNDGDVQNRIFAGTYNVKRLMPARVLGEATIESFGHAVSVMTHDASTLGGTAGAPLIDVTSGNVLGLNFAGMYLRENYAVPAWELMRDARVRLHLGVAEPEWMSLWDKSDSSVTVPVSAAFKPNANAIKTYSYLAFEELLELCDLLLLGFPDDAGISVLFVGIPPEIVAALPGGANPKEKLVNRLNAINRFGKIGKHSPLYRVLQTACHLRTLFPEHQRLLALFQLVAANESLDPT